MVGVKKKPIFLISLLIDQLPFSPPPIEGGVQTEADTSETSSTRPDRPSWSTTPATTPRPSNPDSYNTVPGGSESTPVEYMGGGTETGSGTGSTTPFESPNASITEGYIGEIGSDSGNLGSVDSRFGNYGVLYGPPQFAYTIGSAYFDYASTRTWERHLRGDFINRGFSFGASYNGTTIKPWSFGPVPNQDITGSGTATYKGELAGFLNNGDYILGVAELKLYFSSLKGDFRLFTLSTHTGTVPASGGVAGRWVIDELNYKVKVDGNTFTQVTSESTDSGYITGMFYGNHDLFGGIVERTDFKAAFGGFKR